MSYLVDTNILSELRKGDRCDYHVREWSLRVAPEEVFVSVLSLGEIRNGIELLRGRNPMAARGLEKWLAGLALHYRDRILPVTCLIADRWGRLAPKQPLPPIDGLLAATGIEHKLTVVTRNIRDFARTGVGTFDPFGNE